MKVFIFTDLEGASGVCRFFQTRETGPRYDEACRLLSRDYREGGHWAVPKGV